MGEAKTIKQHYTYTKAITSTSIANRFSKQFPRSFNKINCKSNSDLKTRAGRPRKRKQHDFKDVNINLPSPFFTGEKKKPAPQFLQRGLQTNTSEGEGLQAQGPPRTRTGRKFTSSHHPVQLSTAILVDVPAQPRLHQWWPSDRTAAANPDARGRGLAAPPTAPDSPQAAAGDPKVVTLPALSGPSFPGLTTSLGLEMAQVFTCPGVFSPLPLKASNSKQRPGAIASLSGPCGHIFPKPSKTPAIPPISNGYHCNSATFALPSQAKCAAILSSLFSVICLNKSPTLRVSGARKWLPTPTPGPRTLGNLPERAAWNPAFPSPTVSVYHKRFHAVSDIVGL